MSWKGIEWDRLLILAVAIVAVVLALLWLTGCGSAGDTQPSSPGHFDVRYSVFHVKVDGRQVPCIMGSAGASNVVSMSCDWSQP